MQHYCVSVSLDRDSTGRTDTDRSAENRYLTRPLGEELNRQSLLVECSNQKILDLGLALFKRRKSVHRDREVVHRGRKLVDLRLYPGQAFGMLALVSPESVHRGEHRSIVCLAGLQGSDPRLKLLQCRHNAMLSTSPTQRPG